MRNNQEDEQPHRSTIITAMGPSPRLDGRDPYLSIGTVNIYVRDVDESLRFYVDQLGFKLVFDRRYSSRRRQVAVTPPDGSTALTLIAPAPESREYELIGRGAQVVFITEDVMAKYREWRARGVQFQQVPRLRRVRWGDPQSDGEPSIWGGVTTRFKDPDGNAFSLVGFDAITREIEAQRRAAAEKLEAERRAAQELEIAKQVQARLFPQTLPPLSSLTYAGACSQARQVGGDYYDFLHLGDERLGLVIGDTSGKGMAAALLMANLQANLRSQCAMASGEPERFLCSVNRLFFENTTESAYATLFFAEYCDRERRLRYANCGHLSGLLLHADHTLERLQSTTTVLGLFREWKCPVREVSLSPGDTLALYTDGVTESFNAAEEEFGECRLIEALQRNRERPPEAVIDSIIGEVQRFSSQEQYDDITLVVARCR
jgi:serine phosphatase RsbU (regulator of sigma subunit)/catechol 2,3-dioxygenase-like lactoylglutathione lyase family enzyme